MFKKFMRVIGKFLAIILVYNVVMRMLRRYVKFPAPAFIMDLIDNRARHAIQPPEDMPKRHGLKPGMKVLEVGPGSGTYTIATAKFLGPEGQITAVDIEPKIIEKLTARFEAEEIANAGCQIADVARLPFEDNSFDAIYMIAVLGELPDLPAGVAEFKRVLKPDGILAISELLVDPDYFLPGHLEARMAGNGFIRRDDMIRVMHYTMTFFPLN